MYQFAPTQLTAGEYRASIIAKSLILNEWQKRLSAFLNLPAVEILGQQA